MKIELPLIFAVVLVYSVAERFSAESLTGFSLSVFMGVIGWIGYQSRTNSIDWRFILRTFSMGLSVAYVVDLFCWYKSANPELRAAMVAVSACFAEPILIYTFENRTKIFKRIFGNGKDA